MEIRIFSVLALTLPSFSFSPLAEAHPVRGLPELELAANWFRAELGNRPEGRATDMVEWEERFGDDGDLDSYLLKCPGGDNAFRFGGFLAAASDPEPSTFSLVQLAAVCFPFRASGAQNRNN